MARRRPAASEHHYTWFDSPVGKCALSWTPRGITCLQLPERTKKETLLRLTSRHKEPPVEQSAVPPEVRAAIGKLVRHLEGKRSDLGSIKIDLDGLPPFHSKVYEAARLIPRGQTVSYRQLASAAGSPAASRAVGQAMAKNPLPIIVPCHRVLGSDGSAVGFSAYGGCGLKERLLQMEGAELEQTFKRRFDQQSGRPKAARQANLGDKRTAREALAHLSKADRQLAKLIDRVGEFRLQIKHDWTPFEALAKSIAYQQLTGKAAATIFGRVEALYGDRLGTPAQVAATAEETLRSAGLSRSKALALLDLAEKAKEGIIPELDQLEQMSDDEIVERLTAVRGIGRWTVEMLLIFRLGRPDVLPIHDYGVQKGFAIAFNRKGKLPLPKELGEYGEKWRPYRSVASWYLWRANEL